MAQTRVINIDELKRYAKTYDGVLRVLPFFSLQEFAQRMKLNVIEVRDEDVLVNFRRKAGNTGPYKAGASIDYPDEIGKIVEMSLKPELTVSRIKDNIQNYKEKRVISNAGEPVDHVSKRHPLEKTVIDNMVISHTEDVIFSAFFAERNEGVYSPLTAFTGFFPWIDHFKTTSDISLANQNLVPTGEFGSGDGVDDYDRLVQFLRQAHPMLKRGAVLYYSSSVELVCKEALRKKTSAFKRPTSEEFWEAVKDDANFPMLQPVTHEAYGTGSALILVKPGMLDLGVNTRRASQFVQVRDIFEDPNDVQFWLQSAYGTRFQDVHRKVFQVNECTNQGVDLAGDYVGGGSVTVTLAGLDDPSQGAWKIGESGSWMASGKTAVGVPAGTQTIIYKEVSGYTKPANGSVTVADGKDASTTGTYSKS